MEGSGPTPDRASASERAAASREKTPRGSGDFAPGSVDGDRDRSLRRAILVRLRRGGPATPDQLARALGVSRTGVLGQLRRLEAGSLVQHEPERHGVGRPRHRYDLTERAQALFPAAYDGLARGLLAAIRRVGDDELVEQIFEARRQEIAERATSHLAERLNGDRSTEARTRELAVFQDAHGYLADTVTGSDGRIRLRQHNCAIHDIASDEPAACEAELRLFRELLGEDVVRESHIASGDRACVYRVGDRQDAATEEP